ncbi:MAG: cysteine methyltransferase, partial [Candidatus Hydrogenedentota bacterium]
MSDKIQYSHIATPVGKLLLVRGAEGLRRIFFESGKGKGDPEGDWVQDDGAFGDVRGQLKEYFAGERTE